MREKHFNSFVLVIAMAIFISAPTTYAQRIVDVPAGYGTLQAVLSADSANRVANNNTIYRVHRGNADSVYYLTSTLTGWGTMPLHIESSGSGDLPAFIMVTLSDGSTITPMISATANLTLKGVFINGLNTLGVAVDRVIRIQNDSVTVSIDSCLMNMSSQSFIRVDNNHARIYLKDCRVSNIYSDWSNARGIDNRGVTIDTLSMIGCSFYRIGYRVYRDGGGILSYAFIDHNTFTEIGSSIFGLGSTINFTYINNLAVNCEFLGQGKSSTGRLISMTAIPNSGQKAYVAHNVFYADTTALHAAFTTSSDTTVFAPWFADTIVTFINAASLASTNISSPVTFTKAPNDVAGAVQIDSIARWYWRNPNVNTGDASILRLDDFKAVDLSYNADAPAYTFGTDGKPAGAAEWFGIAITGVREKDLVRVPAGFSLDQNYPNPFNPSTAISYQLPVNSFVSVKVYDEIGKEVARLVSGEQSAGTYTVRWNAANFSSGIYFYDLNAGSYHEVRKMVLLK
ncbi:MAG TPA: T9SS type A sorting domain-containing protein [Bacteroidota bacterium]|nr:T9SS type A sorting domain-containing protein [Bacteroidota bacterium]